MTPRALRTPVRAMARPARPPAERRAVLEAAAQVRAETGLTAADPIARIIAVRTVDALKAYLDEDMDPVLAAAGEFRRRTDPTPYDALATNPDIESIALFVDERLDKLANRSGRGLPPDQDAEECARIWKGVQYRLANRYTRQLRK